METTTHHVGHRLKAIATEKRLSARQLGDLMQMSEQGVHRAYRAEFLTKKVIDKFCEALNVAPEDLFKEKETKQVSEGNGLGYDLNKYVADLERQVFEQAVFIEVLLKRGKSKASRLQARHRLRVLDVPLYE